MEAVGGRCSWEIDPYISLSPPYPNSQGTVCTHVNLWVTHREFAVLTNVGVQNDNIHIMEFFSLLYHVVDFCGIGSTPYKGSRIFTGEYFT